MSTIKWLNSHHHHRSIVIIVIIVLATIRFAHGTRSSPDIGLCETTVNGTTDTLDCLSGTANFCCLSEPDQTVNKGNIWTKKCCEESEYVLQNV